MRPLLVITILGLAGFAGCTSSSPAQASCSADGIGAVQALDLHVGSNPDGSMYLTPSTVTVAHCAKAQFVVHNDDAIFHDVALLNYAGDSFEHEAEPGQTVSTHHAGIDYFVAKASGSFPIICEVKGHAEKGMKGTFVVN